MLGRILPEFFPSIFGEDEKQPLDAEAAKEALKKITDQVNEQSKSSGQPDKSVEEVKEVSGSRSRVSVCLPCVRCMVCKHTDMCCDLRVTQDDVGSALSKCPLVVMQQPQWRWSTVIIKSLDGLGLGDFV